MDKNTALIELSESERTRFWKADFDKLTRPEQIFLLIWELESEVNNGGFTQYFMNSSGDNAMFAPDALREIGAPKMADIVHHAIVMYPNSPPSHDQDKRERDFDPIPEDERWGFFGELDDEFMAYPENLCELLFEYVCKHRSQITGAEDFGLS